jgi:filamentous hemagglutinin family protein
MILRQVTLLLLTALAATNAQALVGQQCILDLYANGGINPATTNPWALNDTYRYIFVTSTTTTATSTDIADYNVFVQTAADASPLNIGTDEGITTWKAIGSTLTVDAINNTASASGSSEAIFMMDGTTKIADNYTDLWDDTIDNNIDTIEDGVTTINGEVWTGTSSVGLAHSSQYLGNGGNVAVGSSNVMGGGWLNNFNFAPAATYPMYAMSPVMTIQNDPAQVATTAQTTISVSATSVTADGTSTATITLQPKEASNNNICTSAPIALSANGSAVISSVTKRGNGTYTATITNNVAEAITISGTLNGSTITDTATVTFTNDAPVLGGTFTTAGTVNDNATISPFSGVTVADTESDNVSITLSYTAANGTLTGAGLTGSAGSYTLSSAALATVQSRLQGLTFTPTVNQVTPANNVMTTFTLTPSDAAAGAANATTVITATSINDNPTLISEPTDVSVTEDVASDVDLSASTLADVDATGSDFTLVITAAAGTITASTGGSVTISNSGTSTITLTGTPANIDTYLNTASNLKYTSALNANGEDVTTLTLTVNDQDGSGNLAVGTVNIDITAQNDAPTVSGVPTAITVMEDTLSNVDLSAVSYADVDSANITLTLMASTGTFEVPADGAATGAGVIETLVSATTITLAGSPSDINAYMDTATNMRYTGASNFSGNGTATLTLSASDGALSLAFDPVININLTAVNDIPTVTGSPAFITVTQDTLSNVNLSGLNFVDIDNDNLTVAFNISTGTFASPADGSGIGAGVLETLVSPTSIMLAGLATDINTYLDSVSNLQYTGPVGINGIAVATITVSASDGTAPLAANPVVNIDITSNNTAPVLGGTFTTAGTVNDNATITPFSGVTVSDAESSNVSVSITYTAANGTFSGTGLTGTAGSYTLTTDTPATIQSNLQGLTFTPTANQVAPASTVVTTFTVTPNDAASGTPNATTVVTTTSINDAPTLSNAPASVTLIEDALSNIDLSSVIFADADIGTSLTTTLTASAGTFATPADGSTVGAGVVETLVSATSITLAGTAADISTYLDTATNIQYTGASNVYGSAAANLTLSVNDGSLPLISDPIINIDITAVNDVPTFTNLNGVNASSINGAVTIIDPDATVADSDLDALNSGLGDWNGASLTVRRTGGANNLDLLSIQGGGDITVVGTNINTSSGGQTFASFDNTSTPGEIVITFSNAAIPATTLLVQSVLQHAALVNSLTPPVITLDIIVYDSVINITGTVSINFIESGPAQINPTDGQFVNGTAPPGSTVTIEDSNGTLLCTTTADAATGNYHCIISSVLPNGELLSVIATDLAGTSVSSSITVTTQDTDGDGTSDVIENLLGTDANVADSFSRPDTDSDGIPDYHEIIFGSDQVSADKPVSNGQLDDDADGVANGLEYYFDVTGGATDSELSTDTDGDGIPDVTELVTQYAHFNDVDQPQVNGNFDTDSDTVTDAVEYYLLSLSISTTDAIHDYDYDGYSDAMEVRLASNPLTANEPDIDDDGVNNAIEAFLTGSIDDGLNTVNTDRDADGLQDIFELAFDTDLIDPTSAINFTNDGDNDTDGITDAVELYLVGDTTSADNTQDSDGDTLSDIDELTAGSDPGRDSNPVSWVTHSQSGIGAVQVTGHIGGFQAPLSVLTWDLSSILAIEPGATITSSARSVSISGLSTGDYSLSLTMARTVNGTRLSSQVRYSFKVTNTINSDSDHDGASNIYDLNNGQQGDEESLHSAIGYTSLYKMQSEEGSYLRLGTIARMGQNQVSNITAQQMSEFIDQSEVITLGNMTVVPDITTTSNLFDVEIVNLSTIGSVASLVIPLHKAAADNGDLLLFNPNSLQWSFFNSSGADQYLSYLGSTGICPPSGDTQYAAGITQGDLCIEIQVTDGGNNDADGVRNGLVSLTIGIGASNYLPQWVDYDEVSEALDTTENQPIEDETNNETTTNEVGGSSGGGSLDFISLFALVCLALSMSFKAQAAPQNGQVVVGTGNISAAGNLTTINQSSDRLAINWDAFDIANGETVTFVQPSSSSLALNVDFSGSASQIFGNLNANGQVLLLNSAGVLISETASINTHSFLASDLSVDTQDFATGNFTLFDSDPVQGGVSNLGDIQTSGRGGVFIAGQFINNQGDISSSNGNVHLAVTDTLIVSTSSDGLLGVELTEAITTDISADGNLIYNDGSIIALDGNIYLDLFYSDSIKANTVNNQGIVNAVKITENNGQIFLSSNVFSKVPDNSEELDEIISDSLIDERVTQDVVTFELDAQPNVSLDTIMPSCTDSSVGFSDCKKYTAIKRYLGRLLLGGSLPE